MLTVGFVSASENVTADNALDEQSISSNQTHIFEKLENNNESSPVECNSHPFNAKIETKNINTYYKENTELVSYLKDVNNNPLANKKVSILINDKIYNKITDNNGNVSLKINLKPNSYTAAIKFEGDENYASCNVNSIVKVNKATLTIQTKNYKTYCESDLFFKANNIKYLINCKVVL